MSNNSSTFEPEVKEPEVWQIVLGVSAYVINAVSLCLNLLVVYIICSAKELRIPTNALIVSLAFGEVIFVMFSLPFTAASMLSNAWPFTASTCQGTAFMQVLGRTSSSYCLVFVCLDRYIAVSRPLKYATILTLSFSIVSVIIIWCFSLILSLLLLLVWNSYHYADQYFACTVVDPKTSHQGGFVKETVSTYLPAFLNLSCLVVVTKEVKFHHRIFAIVPMMPVAAAGANPGDPSSASRPISTIVPAILPMSRAIGGFNRNTRRALRLFFTMALSHAFLCLPYSVVVMFQQGDITTTTTTTRGGNGGSSGGGSDGGGSGVNSQPLALVTLWMSYLYSVVNPLVIIAFNRKFRSRLVLVWKWCRRLHHQAPRSSDTTFTLSTGLHSILDTTFINNIAGHGLGHAGHGGKISTTLSLRRSGVHPAA